MNVIAVGHDPLNMERLVRLLAPYVAKSGCEFLTVFNGEGYAADLQYTSCPIGRDVAMYAAGLLLTGAPSALFVNDDVLEIDPDPFEQAWRDQVDLAGVPNLASWIPEGMESHQHVDQGRGIRFVRTSAFFATHSVFWPTWCAAHGSAQVFEKSILDTALRDERRTRFLHPTTYADSNVAIYVEALR